MDGHYIVPIIQTVIFLAPMITIFYRQGRKDQILDEVVKDLNGLGKKVADIKSEQSQTLAELKAQMESMNNTLIKVTTWLELIKEGMEKK